MRSRQDSLTSFLISLPRLVTLMLGDIHLLEYYPESNGRTVPSSWILMFKMMQNRLNLKHTELSGWFANAQHGPSAADGLARDLDNGWGFYVNTYGVMKECCVKGGLHRDCIKGCIEDTIVSGGITSRE